MLSLNYYWEFCGQRTYPSVCSLKEMKVEACASTYRDYQERTQVVWQDCLQGSPYAHLLSRKNWLLFFQLCYKTRPRLGFWLTVRAAILFQQHLISNWCVTMRRELQRCETSGLAIKKIPHKMIYCCLNFLSTGTKIPYLPRKLPPKTAE